MITQNAFICKEHLNQAKQVWGEEEKEEEEEEEEKDKNETDSRFIHIDPEGSILRTVFGMSENPKNTSPSSL